MQPKRGAPGHKETKKPVCFDEYFSKMSVLFTFYSYLWCKIFYKEFASRARIIIKRKIFDEKEKEPALLRHPDTVNPDRYGLYFKIYRGRQLA